MSTSTPKVFYMLHRMHQALFRAADRSLQQTFDITSVQSAVLMHLLAGPAGMSEIADVLGQKISSVSGLVDRMAKRGLLQRIASARDGRVVLIELTDEGASLATKALAFVKRTNAQLLAVIGQHADIQAFSDACEAITLSADQTVFDMASTIAVSNETALQKTEKRVKTA